VDPTSLGGQGHRDVLGIPGGREPAGADDLAVLDEFGGFGGVHAAAADDVAVTDHGDRSSWQRGKTMPK